MKTWIAVPTTILLGGTLMVIACSDGPLVDGRATNPSFERTDGGGTSGTTGTTGTSGASSGKPADLPSVPGTGTAWCDAAFGVKADKIESCCSASDKTTFYYQLVGGSLVKVRDTCRVSVEKSVTMGRLHIDTAAVATCKSAFTATCDQVFERVLTGLVDPSCGAAPVGKQALGAPCALPLECADGTTCVGYSATSEGTCKATPAVGQPCGPLLVDGGADSVGFVAAGSRACVENAVCTKGICKALGQAGADCSSRNDCIGQLDCHLAKCGVSGPTDAGTSCFVDGDCKSGLYCAPDGKCAPRKTAGAACTSSSISTECAGQCPGDAGAPSTCASLCGSP